MIGKSGKYYRAGYMAREAGDHDGDGPEGEKLTIEKLLDGYKTTHDGPCGSDACKHPDLHCALEHARKMLGSSDDCDEEMYAAEPAETNSSNAQRGLNRLGD